MSEDTEIKSFTEHSEKFPPPAAPPHSRVRSHGEYQKLWEADQLNPDSFWGDIARQELHWETPFTEVLDSSSPPFYRWFADGRLNVSYNCLDVNLERGLGDKTAIIFERDDGQTTRISYRELHRRVCDFAAGVHALGYRKGDTAIIYLPNSIEAVVAMQACARLGITHSVVFGGFSAHSLKERIQDITAQLVITADHVIRGGKSIPLKATVDVALEEAQPKTVRNVIVCQRSGEPLTMVEDRDLWFADIESDGARREPLPPVPVAAEHPLFVLYTSGSTGKPKGVQHSSAGYLLWAKKTVEWVFDLQDDDIFWCTADVGWITGHSYIAYGPLAAGATQVLFEGVPTYPDAGRFWDMVARHRVTLFYTAPTAIRSLVKASAVNSEVSPGKYDLSSLRILGTVGEPINPDVWRWYHREVGGGRCPIVDTWWQTETGGHAISPLPYATALKPGSCTLPLPGIDAAIVDENGAELPANSQGFLVIRRPWPGMIRTIWGDPERFQSTYFPADKRGYYVAGDGAQRDSEGYFWITGRTDDVLNVSGHRLGTMEVESALVAHPMVAEAAVVGRPDSDTGEAIVAFVVMKGALPEGDKAGQVTEDLRNWVRQEIGSIAKPSEIIFGEGLPKTRSGKTMRRLLRALAREEEITQDTSTLENPSILTQFSRQRPED